MRNIKSPLFDLYSRKIIYNRLNEVETPEDEEEEEEKNYATLLVELLDVDGFVKDNDVQEITNSLFFIKDNYPTPDGLLSNEIFGIIKQDRANIFGYISLGDMFMHPLCYKTWIRLDTKIKNIVHGTVKYTIDKDGYLIEDEHGKTGIGFLKKNIDKIKIKRTNSTKRDNDIKFLTENKNLMFMDKYLVIPPYYRDVNTNKNGPINVGSINKLYASLITSVKALKETIDYGFELDGACRGRIQEIILSIYDWFCGNENPAVEQDATGLSKKMGIVKRTNLSKTTDYAARVVISAPNLRVERLEDLMVDMEHSSVPLASCMAAFYPFMIGTIKRIIDDWLADGALDIINDKGEIERVRIYEPQIQFSDERIKEEMKRFIHGFSNRFIPIDIYIEDENGKKSKNKYYLRFKGWDDNPDSHNKESILVERRMTWVDLFYMAACEVTENKTILITRFPIDSCYNQFPTKIVVASTIDTESIYYGDTYYKWYPKIREEDIGKNTSDLFVDTLQICNLYLGAIGGDYDGDQVSIKGVFTMESNDELTSFINSKRNYINFGGYNMRESDKEAIQSLYNLTKILPEVEPNLTTKIEFA